MSPVMFTEDIYSLHSVVIACFSLSRAASCWAASHTRPPININGCEGDSSSNANIVRNQITIQSSPLSSHSDVMQSRADFQLSLSLSISPEPVRVVEFRNQCVNFCNAANIRHRLFRIPSSGWNSKCVTKKSILFSKVPLHQ